jgi:hypothetical protein
LASSAHVVQQLFVDFSADESSWMAEVRFDAGIALPEMRADKEAMQPKRQWLIDQTPAEHTELRKQAELYLRQCFQFYWVTKASEAPVQYTIDFPEWETAPPEFCAPFTDLGFAYFSIQCSGLVPESGGALEVRVSDGDNPDFAFGYQRVGSDRIVTAYPGKALTLWTAEATPPTTQQSFISFLDYGYRHVVPEGWDHVLFIAALCFLSFAGRPLLTQSLVFTLGHTITLALSICNVIPAITPASMGWIEMLIAATIVYVALENIWTKKLKAHRLITIFTFGLIHGLGFASVLGETIRSSGSVAMPLIAANLGVELGQVTVIGFVLLTLYWAKEKSYFPTLGKTASISIALVGGYWMVERLLANF